MDKTLDELLDFALSATPGSVVGNIMLIVADSHARVVRWRGYDHFGARDFITAYKAALTPLRRQLIQTGQPVIVRGVQDDPDWACLPEELRQAWSYLTVPLRAHGHVVGFLTIGGQDGVFDQDALTNLAGLAVLQEQKTAHTPPGNWR